MEAHQTAANYDRIAHHWSGEDFNFKNGIQQHERALSFHRGGSHAIDIGCGSSGRIIQCIQAHGYEVEGLDISEVMLSLARNKHPEVTFHQADIITWELPRKYDFISAWDSIWPVPLTKHPIVLEKLCAGLESNGILIFTSGGVDEPGEVTNPCHGQPLYHAALGIPKLLGLILSLIHI